MYLRRKSTFMKIFMILFIILSVPLSAISVEELLVGYAETDVLLKELDIAVQQSIISAKRTALQNGINLVFSTGNMEIGFDSNDGGITVSPELSLTLPALNNTTITATTPFQIGTDTSLTEAGVKISTDIISDVAINRSLTIERATRTIELAQRILKTRALSVETEFWQALQALYNSAARVLQAQDDLVTEQIDFNIIKAQGYSIFSAVYRTAELAILSSERAVEESKRLFTSDLGDFAIDCGFPADSLTTLPELPVFVAQTTLLSITDFDPALYINLDESLWDADFNEKLRDADKDFILSVNAGYDHRAATSVANSPSEDRVSAGLNASLYGINLGAGLSVPFDDPSDPKLNLSFSWDLNEGKLLQLSDEEKQYDARLDDLAVEQAEDSWIQQVQTSLTTALDLNWERQRNAEEFLVFEDLYTETQDWYEQGLVSSLDLLQTKTNYEQALYRNDRTNLDILIYNLELLQLFIGGK